MSGKELRKEERFPADLLPEGFRRVNVLFQEEEICVDVADASLNGFGFVIQKPSKDFIKGTNLVLFPLGKDRALHGKIVFVQAVNENSTRIGVKLSDVGSYEEYRNTMIAIVLSLRTSLH